MTAPKTLAGPLADVASTARVEAPLSSRRGFLKRSVGVAAVAGTAGVLMNTSTASAQSANQRAQQRQHFLSIRKHENDHVAFLLAGLGNAARPKPTFVNLLQPTYNDFLNYSTLFENLGVSAYLGATPFINDPDNLAAAAAIALIEARHAGYLNSIQNLPITGNIYGLTADNSFDLPIDPAGVLALGGGFVQSLNGGPDVNFSNVPSDANDVAILNYALALEYLEAEFYNLNVARFFNA